MKKSYLKVDFFVKIIPHTPYKVQSDRFSPSNK